MAAVVTAAESRLQQLQPAVKGSSYNQLPLPETNAAAQKIWNKKLSQLPVLGMWTALTNKMLLAGTSVSFEAILPQECWCVCL